MVYAYIDGTCEGWLPRGEVLVDYARGFEYQPVRAVVKIESGQRELVLRLRRIYNLQDDGWHSGDTHVHFLSVQGAHREARAEGLQVVNLLASQWGHLFTNVEEFTGTPSTDRWGGNETTVFVSQENRQHWLGHLSLLGLKAPVMPFASDGPGEAELGSALESTLCHWADECHSRGGTVILPHFPLPNGETAALIATSRVDAVEMIEHNMFCHTEYYRYLNAGYKLPLAGGTDKMSNDVPIGLMRTYVRLLPDEAFSYQSWCRALRAGRSFVTSGPLLSLTVDGQEAGGTLRIPSAGGTVQVQAGARSIFPIHRLEIICAGHVVESVQNNAGSNYLALNANVRVKPNTWIAARVGGRKYREPLRHNDVWGRGIMAHTSPIYISSTEQWSHFDQKTLAYMLSLTEASLAHIEHGWAHSTKVTHAHIEDDHLAYLQRPIIEARKKLQERLRRRR